MRYFLELRYNGGAYFGWQRQPAMPTVQQTLEQALATLLREPVEVTGAGRTDTGVNASYYVAHFDVSQPVAEPQQLLRKLNFMLPGDIAVDSLTPVADGAHARFDAREREYRSRCRQSVRPLSQSRPAASWRVWSSLPWS